MCGFNSRLIVHFGDPWMNIQLQDMAIEALAWLCRALRPCPNQTSSALFMSQARQIRTASALGFRLQPLSPWNTDVQQNKSACWMALFTNCIVAEQQLSRVWGEGLEISFDMMLQVSGVENFVWLNDHQDGKAVSTRSGGYIAVGFFTALIPISRHPGTQDRAPGIQWHLEFTEDEPISLATLSTKRIPRLPLNNLQDLPQCQCYLGWCDDADILLGTAQMPNTLSWSGLPQRSRSLRASGWNLTGQLGGNLGPVQAIGQVTRTWQLENVRQRFEPQNTYAKALQINSRQVALIFDVTAKRAWLVPKLSLMLHLCHTFVRHFKDEGMGSIDRVPFAEPSNDGALAAKEALSGHGDILVFSHGSTPHDQIRLRNILVDISSNMSQSLAAGERPRFLRALSPELMDMIAEPGSGSLLAEVPTKYFPSSSSNSFPQLADSVYVCSDLGTAIRPSAASGQVSCGCMNLERDKGYVAVHLRCLEALLQRRNKSLLRWPSWGLPLGDGRQWCPDPYVPCSHQGNVSYWAKPRNFVQTTSRSRYMLHRSLPMHEVPVITGARVFGGVESIWDRVRSIWRREESREPEGRSEALRVN